MTDLVPEMVALAKAIAFNLDRYTPEQRKAIARHACFCADVADIEKRREEDAYAPWFRVEAA